MTSYEAENSANGIIANALKDAGLVDGISKTDSQVAAETKTMFWRLMPTAEGVKKDTYVCYSFTTTEESQTNSRADNKAAFYTVYASIDLYSTKRLTDTAVKSTLSAIAEKLEAKNIIVTFSQDMYDSAANRHHKPLDLEIEIS